MTLFVLIDLNTKDLETQAVFEKDNFYCVGGKIVPTYYGKIKKQRSSIHGSNKCSLKVSLIKVSKEMLKKVKNNENAIIQMSITDYIGEESTYQNILKNSKEKSENENTSSLHSSSFYNKYKFDLLNILQSLKFMQVKDNVTDNEFHMNNNNYVDLDQEEELTKDNIDHQKKRSNSRKKSKEPISRFLCNTLRSHDSITSVTKPKTK
ncbi:17826_t:CDS:2 [Cetraspora pellucida]|uniref:17826_t:CDS:1 n=1 Tax=Cetraspora pellucida TaxID=1433469 RepID=A0A9N9IYP6_9GLOM|nr:17826_t:CDS:2 [Cetraspora pellucida]